MCSNFSERYPRRRCCTISSTSRFRYLDAAARLSVVIGTIMCFLPQPSVAQTAERSPEALVGTLKIESNPIRSSGRLVGCTLGYDALVRDWVYRKGAVSAVTGYFGVVRLGPTVGSTLKVTVSDVSDVDGQQTINTPTSAYLMSESGAVTAGALIEQSSDNTGALLGAFLVDETFWSVVESMLTRQRVAIMFSRTKGGLDVRVDLDLTVAKTSQLGERTNSGEMLKAYLACLRELVR
jgi:hypothetical protein